MGLFRSEEDKAAREKQRAQEAYANSPVGLAIRAREEGQKYYQAVFPIEYVGRDALAILGHNMNTKVKDAGEPIGIILTDIENAGWELVHTGFVFRQTHQDSRDKFLASGQQVAITGQTVGIYLFKARKAK
jgi:hypothetical protein